MVKVFNKQHEIYLQEPLMVYEDDNGYFKCIVQNRTSHIRSRHVDIKYHIFAEIKLSENYIISFRQLPDILTKSLPAAKCTKFRITMGLEIMDT